MYDPLSVAEEEDISLQQAQFLHKYFIDVNFNKDLVDLIKDECPAPAILEETRQLDQEILDMLPANMNAPAKTATRCLSCGQNSLRLGSGWHQSA